jgi:hypothetical protein
MSFFGKTGKPRIVKNSLIYKLGHKKKKNAFNTVVPWDLSEHLKVFGESGA